MTSRRRWLFAVGALALAQTAGAQQRGKIWRVAFLGDGPAATSAPDRQVFLQRMKELGYTQGTNLAFEARSAESDLERLPGLAEALVAGKPDVLLATNSTPTRALMKLTKTIPIVFASSADPVAAGLVASLAHPGGNVTGSSNMVADTAGKRIELLQELVPNAKRFGFLGPIRNPGVKRVYANLQAAARTRRVSMRLLDASTSGDVDRAFATLAAEPIDALITAGVMIRYRKQLSDLTLKHKLPALYVFREHIDAGGLMSFGSNLTHGYRRAAEIVDRILRGANPGELPVEQHSQHLAINMKTAQALGINVPRSLMARADEVVQ